MTTEKEIIVPSVYGYDIRILEKKKRSLEWWVVTFEGKKKLLTVNKNNAYKIACALANNEGNLKYGNT